MHNTAVNKFRFFIIGLYPVPEHDLHVRVPDISIFYVHFNQANFLKFILPELERIPGLAAEVLDPGLDSLRQVCLLHVT
jgi:hypothetical protein